MLKIPHSENSFTWKGFSQAKKQNKKRVDLLSAPFASITAPEEKAEPPQAMNALMRLNQLKPGLQYKLLSQTGPVHVPVFTMAVEVDGKTFEASGPSKRTAKLHVAVKVRENPLLGLGCMGSLSVWHRETASSV